MKQRIAFSFTVNISSFLIFFSANLYAQKHLLSTESFAIYDYSISMVRFFSTFFLLGIPYLLTKHISLGNDWKVYLSNIKNVLIVTFFLIPFSFFFVDQNYILNDSLTFISSIYLFSVLLILLSILQGQKKIALVSLLRNNINTLYLFFIIITSVILEVEVSYFLVILLVCSLFVFLSLILIREKGTSNANYSEAISKKEWVFFSIMTVETNLLLFSDKLLGPYLLSELQFQTYLNYKIILLPIPYLATFIENIALPLLEKNNIKIIIELTLGIIISIVALFYLIEPVLNLLVNIDFISTIFLSKIKELKILYIGFASLLIYGMSSAYLNKFSDLTFYKSIAFKLYPSIFALSVVIYTICDVLGFQKDLSFVISFSLLFLSRSSIFFFIVLFRNKVNT